MFFSAIKKTCTAKKRIKEKIPPIAGITVEKKKKVSFLCMEHTDLTEHHDLMHGRKAL